MGLSEKARHTLARDLLRLLEGEGAPSPQQVRELTLALDAYRRELRVYVARHQNHARLVDEDVDRAEREVARWEQRHFLAERRAPELQDPVKARLVQVREKRDRARQEQAVLARAIANLEVARERVEQALRYVRRQVQPLDGGRGGRDQGGSAAEPGRSALYDSQAIRDLKDALLVGDDDAEQDDLEEALCALELEELAGDLQAPRSGA